MTAAPHPLRAFVGEAAGCVTGWVADVPGCTKDFENCLRVGVERCLQLAEGMLAGKTIAAEPPFARDSAEHFAATIIVVNGLPEDRLPGLAAHMRAAMAAGRREADDTLRFALEAIESGRSEPLFIARDGIRRLLEDGEAGDAR